MEEASSSIPRCSTPTTTTTGQTYLGLQSSRAQWVLATALEATEGGAAAALPAALLMTPLCPGQPASSTAGLAWPSPAGSQSQGLLCPANDHAASNPGHHPSSGAAAANYRACWPRQQRGQESQPPGTPHPLALMLWSPPLPSRVTKDTAEVGALGAQTPTHSPMGKQGHRGRLIHPKSHSQPVQGPGPWMPGQVFLPRSHAHPSTAFLSLEKKAHFQVFLMPVMLSRCLGRAEQTGYLLQAVKLFV